MKRRLQKEEGFTLFEIIAVLFLVAALYALVGPSIWKRLETGKVQTARAQMALLKNCLNDYRLDMGTYPSSAEGLAALRVRPASDRGNWNGPYIEGPIPKDPWGNDYVYRFPGTGSYNSFDLYSLGADGEEGGSGINADISLWGEEEDPVYSGLPEG